MVRLDSLKEGDRFYWHNCKFEKVSPSILFKSTNRPPVRVFNEYNSDYIIMHPDFRVKPIIRKVWL